MSTPIQITDAAAKRIRELLDGEDQSGWGLRFGLTDGGCSGYTYKLDFEAAPEDEDLVVEQSGVRVFIHPLHLPFLQGSTINWVDELMETGFRIENPNVSSECGCGTSFDV